MGKFLEFMFRYSIVESLDSPVDFKRRILEDDNERYVQAGKFIINKKEFEYLIEINKKYKAMNVMFHQFINDKASYGSINNLSPKEILSVFSTIKEIILEHIDNIDQIEYEAADSKLLKFYRKLASSYLSDFKHAYEGLNGKLYRKSKLNVLYKFKDWKGMK